MTAHQCADSPPRPGARPGPHDAVDAPLGPGLAALARMSRRGRPGGPAVVHGDRLLILLEPGCAEEIPGLLRWLGWGHLDGVLRPGSVPDGDCAPRAPGVRSCDALRGWGAAPGADLCGNPAAGGGTPPVPRQLVRRQLVPRQRTVGATRRIGTIGCPHGTGPTGRASGTGAAATAVAPCSWLCGSGSGDDRPTGLDLRTQELPWMLDTLADACARALLHPAGDRSAAPVTGLPADPTIACCSADQVVRPDGDSFSRSPSRTPRGPCSEPGRGR